MIIGLTGNAFIAELVEIGGRGMVEMTVTEDSIAAEEGMG
jgi:cytoskeletal protein CcmA (bactofilin family)